MKWLVWVFLLINIGLAGYFGFDSLQKNQSFVRPDVAPNKVSLLDNNALTALPKKTIEVAAIPVPVAEPVPAPIQTSCYEWGIFSKTNLVTAKAVLSRLALGSVEKKQTSQESQRFWVYIPPLKSAALAQAKAEQVKALGIQDIFIVQEPQWRNAISFGVFQDEKLATNLLSELKTKGVNSAVKSLRSQGKEHVSLLLKDVSLSAADALKNMKAEFPGSEIKSMTCAVGV